MQHGIGIVVTLAAFNCVAARAQESLHLVSATPAGQMGNHDSSGPRVSGDGRFVSFESRASDLVAGDTNGEFDVFVRDLDLGVLERVTLSSTGAQISGGGSGGGVFGLLATNGISRDGSRVTFCSDDPNVVTGDTNGARDVFVRNRIAGTTTRVSLRTGGAEFAGHCGAAQISADGTRVLFAHQSVPMSWNPEWYVHDLTTGVTRLVSVVPDGSGAEYRDVRLAAGGRHVLFQACSTSGPACGTFVHDVDAGVTVPASARSGWRGYETVDTGLEELEPIAISASGRFVLCSSDQDLDPNDGFDVEWHTNAWVLDRNAGTYRLVTRQVFAPGTEWHPEQGAFRGFAFVSDDGRIVRLGATSSQGLIGWNYDSEDPFYEVDLATSEMRVLSLDWRMRPFSGYTNHDGRFAASDDGATVAIAITEWSGANPWGASDRLQVYVRRVRGSAGTTFCAGDGTGAGCPCGTPGIAGRGCASAFTPRGAQLSTRGNASLSDDSLTFVAYEATWGPSVLLQSSSASPSGGAPFGGGVLCVAAPALRIAMDEPFFDDLQVVKLFGRGAFYGPLVHELGGISGPGTRYYQVWTRAVGGPSCVQSRSSLTNGVRVEWRL